MTDRLGQSEASGSVIADTARDVLDYLNWWDYMLWREAHRSDPSVEWQDDLSIDEIAAMVGVEAPRVSPGDVVLNVELATELYWPGALPVHIRKRPSRSDIEPGGSR